MPPTDPMTPQRLRAEADNQAGRHENYYVATLLRDAADQLERNGWQPISTAPLNVDVLLAGDTNSLATVTQTPGGKMSDYEKLTDKKLMELVVTRMFPNSWKGYCCEESFARLVRDGIAELGLVSQFIENLDNDFPVIACDATTWARMQATPRQQCLAALLALDGK